MIKAVRECDAGNVLGQIRQQEDRRIAASARGQCGATGERPGVVHSVQGQLTAGLRAGTYEQPVAQRVVSDLRVHRTRADGVAAYVIRRQLQSSVCHLAERTVLRGDIRRETLGRFQPSHPVHGMAPAAVCVVPSAKLKAAR